ncbi:hypothetical protein NB311A_09956 [Nitrobacter sp. Nb-311A]|nr:hypothetical protein NB311A_09956 [Nitrobacter sp. Nb-311A]
MKKYQAYLIGDDGRIAGFDKMICRNDAEALRKARHFAGDSKLEVWTGPRLVTAVPSGGGTSATPLPKGIAPIPTGIRPIRPAPAVYD